MKTTIELMNYKAVWFDAADTLLQSADAITQIRFFLSERGISKEMAEIAPIVRQVMDERYYNKKHAFEAICTPESDRAFWVALYSELFSRLAISQESEQWSHELYDKFTHSSAYTLFDDVIGTFNHLVTNGYKVGIISNFAPTLRQILIDLAIPLEDLHVLLVSTEVQLEKPNPAIFQMGLVRTGLAAEEVLYVGDHPVNDVEAPNLIGMDAVRIKRYPHQTGDGITTFNQLFSDTIPFLSKGSRV